MKIVHGKAKMYPAAQPIASAHLMTRITLFAPGPQMDLRQIAASPATLVLACALSCVHVSLLPIP